MKRKILPLLTALTLPARLLGDSVTVTITVDNGYGFGFGDRNGIYAGQYYGGVDNCTAAQIFGSPCYVFVPPDGTVTDTGPEIYNITAGSGDYIYIVAWSDDQADQGTIASFTDNTTGTTVTTSPAWPWQVFATGINWQPNCSGVGAHGPPLTGFPYAINDQIAVANANGGAPGATSVGWVGANGVTNGSLYFGGYGNGYNNFNYPYPVPACLAAGSTWMEYDPEPTNVNCNPFVWDSVNDYTNANFLREYLIYRIGPLSELTTSNTCTSSNRCLSLSVPTNIVVYSCSNCVQEFYTPTATDKCCQETLTVTCNPPSGTCFYPGTTTTVTCTATDDGCGNSVSCSFTVTVICTNCLQVVCPADKTVPCGSTWAFDQPTASSCCTNQYGSGTTGPPTNVLITSMGFVTNGVCPQLTITESWLITDLCGDSNTCSQTVTVLGCCSNNCLQVQCTTNKTAQCGTAWTFDPPSATSCCTSNVSGTLTNLVITTTGTATNSGPCPQIITRTWLITDGCGDTQTCTQTVTVVDTTPPVITCPTGTVTVPLNKNCQLVIPGISVTATDNCTPVCSLRYSQSPPAGTTNLSGNTAVITVTVTDLCGNSNHCSVTVVGEAETPPLVTVAGQVTATNCYVPCVPVTATAFCCTSPPSITQSPPCGTPIAPGINSVTITVTDCHGNVTHKTVHLVIAAQSFLTNLFNTGVNSSHALLVDDTVDPHYALPAAAVPAGMPADYNGNAVVVSPLCHSSGTSCAYSNVWGCVVYFGWDLNATAASKWIAPNYTNNGCDPHGGYTYTLQFLLPPGFNPATATISGRWAAADRGFMFLNSSPVPAGAGGTSSCQVWTPFTIPAGSPFVSGLNTLSFTVTNIFDDNTGLKVEFTNAYANCFTCAPPVIRLISPALSLPAGSTATFTVVAGGTPPLTYQWYLNGVPLAGATNPTLQVPSITLGDAGLYSVAVSNPCGAVTQYTSLNVTQPWGWPIGLWNVAVLSKPLASTFGPDLTLVGSSTATNYALSVGTTEDFGLPEEGGQIVNVMHINPQAGASLQVPLIAAAGSSTDNCYTVIMDLYEPDTSLGTPSTLFASIGCCISNLTSGGQDGLAFTLDSTNNLHLTGSVGGAPFDAVSTVPLPVDAWNRVALVVNTPSDGGDATVAGYLNGQNVVNVIACPCCVCCQVNYSGTSINWNNGSPTVLSATTDAVSPNAEFYVSSIQFHAVAMTPQMIAGIGSPDTGPAPANQTSVGPQPVLAATVSGGMVSLSWTGTPYVLQETTDLTSGVWVDSALPFTEQAVAAGGSGNTQTTAIAAPATGGAPQKFFRLIWNPR